MSISILNGAMDLVEIDGEERLVIRGVIDPASLPQILTPVYQREILADGKVDVLKTAIKTSRVPDIDLGMRGFNVTELGDGRFLLQDDVYVIDGLQRSTAAKRLFAEGTTPHLGAMVHVGTNEDWERKRFQALNVGQTGLHSNVILRNLAEENPSAKLVYTMTLSKTFVLHDKVCWGQNMRRNDLISAVLFYKVIGRLHSHLGPGRSDPRSLASSGIPKIISTVTGRVFQSNVNTFFTFLNEAYDVLDVAYRQHAIALKASFLIALAGVISDHEDFWDGNKLVISADLRRKLATFPLLDPHVKGLAGSAGTAIQMLEMMLQQHIDSGKRTRRLKRRDYIAADETVGGEQEEE